MNVNDSDHVTETDDGTETDRATIDAPEIANLTEDELYAALCAPPPAFAEAALRQAMADPDLSARVTRRLLSEALDAARSDDPDELEFGPLYALYLAGYHEDPALFELVADIGRLDPNRADDVFGDVLAWDLARILWVLSGRDASKLYRLLDDPDISDDFADSVLHALASGVAAGVLDRVETLRALGERLDRIVAEAPAASEGEDEDEDEDDSGTPSELATWIVVMISDLGVGAEKDVLDRAYARGVVFEYILDAEECAESAARTPEEVMSHLRERRGEDDRIDPFVLRKWPAFNPGASFDRGRPASASRPSSADRDATRAKARKKGKAQRKARKKGRKKKK